MNKKHDHTGFYYLFGVNRGVWVLIAVHLLILFALIQLFSSIIERMGSY